MLTINEILELIKSNKINVSNLNSKDLIRIEFCKNKLNEGAIIIEEDVENIVEQIIDTLKTNILIPYVESNEKYKGHDFFDDDEVKIAGNTVNKTIISHIFTFLQSIYDSEITDDMFPIKQELNINSYDKSIKDLLIDDRLYMIYYPNIIFDLLRNKTKKYDYEMKVLKKYDNGILVYDDKDFIFYIDDISNIRQHLKTSPYFTDELYTAFTGQLFNIKILNTKLVLHDISDVVENIFKKYGVQIGFNFTFKNPKEEGFNKESFTADGVFSMVKNSKRGIISIKTQSLGVLYQTLMSASRIKLLKSIIKHELLHVQDFINRLKTQSPNDLKYEPHEFYGNKTESNKHMRRTLYVTEDHELQAYAKTICDLLLDFIFNKTNNKKQEIKDGIKQIETNIFKLNDILKSEFSDTSDYTIIQHYIDIKDSTNISIPIDKNKNKIINGKKVWKKLVFYVTQQLNSKI